jgi:hypothetical protein
MPFSTGFFLLGQIVDDLDIRSWALLGPEGFWGWLHQTMHAL